MVTLNEALAEERANRQRAKADSATRQQIARTVLEALAERLNAEPIPGWAFVLDDQTIRVFRIYGGPREQVGTWTVDEKLRLVTGERMTEWITAESYSRVIDEALEITALLMVGAETAGVAKPHSGVESAEVVELPP